MSENTVVQPATTDTQASEPAGKPAAAPKRQPAAAKPTQAQASADAPPAAVKPRFLNRHDKAFRLDLFKCSVAIMKKNESFVHKKPQLVDLEHTHIYRSHSGSGQKKIETHKMGGHFHYVEQSTDPVTGLPVAKCGPPMMEMVFMGEDGNTYTRIEQVAYEKINASGPHAGQTTKIVDTHTHEMEYLGSEELSGTILKQQMEADKAAAAAMGVTINPGSVQGNTPRPLTAADGYTME